MSKFLLLMPIWLGLLVFLTLRAFRVKGVWKFIGFISAGIILGGVFSFVYADMSMATSNYIGVTFAELRGEEADTPKVKSKYDPPSNDKKVNANKSTWGTEFWVQYRKKVK